MKKGIRFPLVLFVVLVSLGCAITASAKTIELKFAYFPPPVAEICRLGFEQLGPALESATGERAKIKYFGGSSLGAPPAHFDLVVSGTADIVAMSPEFTPGTFPIASVANLPGTFPNSEVAAAALYQVLTKYALEKELKKVKLLAVAPTAPSQLLTRKKMVKTLDDVKGMKLAGSSVSHASTISALGGNPVKMVEGEVFTALERGMVDGRLHAWDSAVVWKGMEVTKYRTGNVNGPLNLMLILMNRDSWNKLPADIQNIMTGLTGLNMSRQLGMVFDRANMRMLEVLKGYDKKKGNPEIYWLPEDEQKKWKAAMATCADDWVKEMEGKGLPGKSILSDLNASVKKYQKMYK